MARDSTARANKTILSAQGFPLLALQPFPPRHFRSTLTTTGSETSRYSHSYGALLSLWSGWRNCRRGCRSARMAAGFSSHTIEHQDSAIAAPMRSYWPARHPSAGGAAATPLLPNSIVIFSNMPKDRD